MKLLITAALAVAFFMPSVQAQECLTLPDVVLQIEKGGVFVDLVDIRGDGFNQMLVAVLGDALVVGFVLDGCVVSDPLPVASVTKQILS